jgi:PAS domain S-box-containing protein
MGDPTDGKCSEQDDARYLFFFENAPIPIGEFDFSLVWRYLDGLSTVGGEVDTFFEDNPDELFLCLSQTRVLGLNRRARRALGAEESRDDATRRLVSFISGPLLKLATRLLLRFRKGVCVCEYDAVDLGSLAAEGRHGAVHLVAPPGPSTWETVFVAAVDSSREHSLEIELAANERRYRRVFDHLRDLYIETDSEGTIIELSPSVRDVLGYERSELMGCSVSRIYEKPEDRSAFLELLRKEGHAAGFEARMRRRSGELVVCSINAAEELTEDGSSFNVFDSIRDITESIRQSMELRRLAESKALLVHELQHRVRNNLAILVSLISLQMSEAEEAPVREALASIATRVHSIARVHEMLLPATKAGPIDLRDYLSSILANVCAIFDEKGEFVRYDVKGSTFHFDLDTSMRVGLIVNELALNSFRHAFLRAPSAPDAACLTTGRRPMIFLRFEMLEDGSCRLFFGDNGPGLPEGFDFGSGRGLGHLLIDALTQQLGGRFIVMGPAEGIAEREATGARFALVFPFATAARMKKPSPSREATASKRARGLDGGAGIAGRCEGPGIRLDAPRLSRRRSSST